MEGSTELGCFCALGSPLVAEILARSGSFDWLCIDLQHGMGGFDACLGALHATSAVPIPVMVRVPRDEPALTTRVLDAGAHGVIVANVETREQAHEACSAAFYPPRGSRSVGPTRARLLHEDYVTTSNSRVECIVMVESPQAFAALDDITEEPVSGIFVGMADLALTLGDVTRTSSQEAGTLRLLNRALSVCTDKGLTSGAFSEDVGTAAALHKMGFERVGVGLDASLLVDGARARRDAFDAARSPT